MSRSHGPHHNIWTVRSSDGEGGSLSTQRSKRVQEAGYTLVALLALMTVLAIFAAAAAPNIRRQAQRENEKEAIFRGEQLANAIRTYYAFQQSRMGQGEAALPTSMDQLLEGIPSGTKRVQVLRPSAARDPLTADGEWRLIRPRSGDLSDFQQALLLYTQNVRPVTTDPQLQRIEQLMAPPVIATLGLSSAGSSSIDDSNSSGPFIGVASRSKNNSLINYYGIDHHDEWIFTPLFR
jgi:type II secretory pathway pseudopilin PulG